MACGGVDFALGVDVKGVVRAAKGGGAEGVCSEGGIGGRGGKAGGGGGNEEWKCPKVGDGTGGVAEAGRRAKAFSGFWLEFCGEAAFEGVGTLVSLVAGGRVVGDEESFEGVGALFGIEGSKGKEGE